jgi:hypothetical protein
MKNATVHVEFLDDNRARVTFPTTNAAFRRHVVLYSGQEVTPNTYDILTRYLGRLDMLISDMYPRWEIDRKCTMCGHIEADVETGVDPYTADVHNDPTAELTACRTCFQNRADDI